MKAVTGGEGLLRSREEEEEEEERRAGVPPHVYFCLSFFLSFFLSSFCRNLQVSQQLEVGRDGAGSGERITDSRSLARASGKWK